MEPSSVIDHESIPLKTDQYCWVQLEELLDFLFPVNEEHPKTTARLFLYGEYGPLRKGNLMGGFKRERPLQRVELKEMITDILRQDVIAVYINPGKMVSRQEEEVILREAEPKVKNLTMLTVADVLDLLDDWNLQANEQGLFRFDQLQKCIKKERQRQIEDKKKMFPDLTRKVKPPKEGSPTRELLRRMGSKYVPALVEGRGPDEVTREIERRVTVAAMAMQHHLEQRDFMRTQRTLHRAAFKCCEFDEKNSPDLTKNVTIIRDAAASGKIVTARDGWNPCYSTQQLHNTA